jgi:ferredoxin-type protein NapF
MATAEISRRALFGRFRGGGEQLRPPWSRREEEFTDRCTRCGDCIVVCGTDVIVPGHAGYPIVDFMQGQCTFCGKCREVCQSDCFEPLQVRAPWRLEAAIDKSCIELSGVTCRVCQDVCERDAIAFRPLLGGRSKASVMSERCTGCGACVGTCPVHAVSVDISHSKSEEMAR